MDRNAHENLRTPQDANGPYPPHAVPVAPIAGYTDAPFSRICRACGCRFAFTPLIAARSIIFRNPRTAPLLHRDSDEPWLGLQLEGESPDVLVEAVRRLDIDAWDVLDVNMGCPVPKVTKKGSGAALAEDPDRAARCIDALARFAPGKVTAKIRILDEYDPVPTIRLVERLRNAGAIAVTIHGRTRERVYSGPPAAHTIRAVREAVPGIQIIANGGVRDARTACELRTRTGCSRIMVARGAIGNPWIFREIQEPEQWRPPTHAEVCDMIVQHVRLMLDFYGEYRGMRNARKIILAYLTGRGYRRALRREVTHLSTWAEFEDFMDQVRAEGVSPHYHPAP